MPSLRPCRAACGQPEYGHGAMSAVSRAPRGRLLVGIRGRASAENGVHDCRWAACNQAHCSRGLRTPPDRHGGAA